MTYDEEIEEYKRVIHFLEETIDDQEREIKKQDEVILNLEKQIKLMAEESFANKEVVKKAIKDIREIRSNTKGRKNDLLE